MESTLVHIVFLKKNGENLNEPLKFCTFGPIIHTKTKDHN